MRNELLKAKKLYKEKRYSESYNLYTRLYDFNPNFDNSSKYSYAWAIYQTKVRNCDSAKELEKNAELITNLTRQNDLNKNQLCVYTMSVFKVIKTLYNQKSYKKIPHWLDKINSDLLDEARFTKEGRIYPSRKESYYIYASKTYLALEDYERCIRVSKKALNTISRFSSKNAMWFEWRIAKSHRGLDEYQNALKHLFLIEKNNDNWFILKEIAENYYFLNDMDRSLTYALRAALKNGPSKSKFNLYSLLYDLLKNDYPQYARKHREAMDLILSQKDTSKTDQELLEIWENLNKIIA